MVGPAARRVLAPEPFEDTRQIVGGQIRGGPTHHVRPVETTPPRTTATLPILRRRTPSRFADAGDSNVGVAMCLALLPRPARAHCPGRRSSEPVELHPDKQRDQRLTIHEKMHDCRAVWRLKLFVFQRHRERRSAH